MQNAEAQTDSLYMSIDSLTFVSEKHTSVLDKDRNDVLKVDMELMQRMPKILGNTDPVNFIRNLPGVQTSSEYDSGIHILGCDNSHNDISIAGVPVYGVNHLFGFFSIFNPSHFSEMKFSGSSSSNRIGGSIEMLPEKIHNKKIRGDVNVGIMSSQGTLGFRTGKSSQLTLSARGSYMNLLYKRWLHIGDSPIRYGFSDGNLTWQYADGKNRVWVDAYWGKDRADIFESTFNLDLNADWGNTLGAVHYEHDGERLKQKHSLFCSGFHTDGAISQDNSHLFLESGINTCGYRGKFLAGRFSADAEVLWHEASPQAPMTDGFYGSSEVEKEDQDGLEASLNASYRFIFADRWELDTDVKGILYLSPERRTFWGLSPRATLKFNGYRFGKISATAGIDHQYLFQTGLSNIGLPIEFWFMAGKHSDPQFSRHASLSYDVQLFHNAYALSARIYFKQLHNQVEYRGDLFDFFNSIYRLDNYLLKGKGWNYGLNLMIHKQSGNLTGWISWSFGRALRRFDHPDYQGIYPANHERIHEINAVCAYRMGKWDFSGTFVYASGAPFTAPESFYLSSGQIMTVFGEHNGCRMRPYMRMDLSVNYTLIRNDRQENGINLSLYNVLARKNDVMYRLQFTDGKYSYQPMAFFLRLVPSVSYYHKF